MDRRDQRSLRVLQRSVIRWYRQHSRNLLWRTTNDPYVVVVSEIMLQQTQVHRVRQKLPLFLKRFPTLRSLARASRADVIRAWSGMGYNARAVRLRELARTVVEKYNGTLPRKITELQQLPGVGPYTAHAVACFAFRQRVATVDVNIHRVLSRLFWKMKSVTGLQKETRTWKLAQEILPRRADVWNQALMDIGATFCVARVPFCPRCPLMFSCASSHLAAIQPPPTQPSPRAEPSHEGIPNRLWRGRIVETLRTLDDHATMPAMKLGKSVKNNFRHSELPWLMMLLRKLSGDGILTLRRTRGVWRVKLADE